MSTPVAMEVSMLLALLVVAHSSVDAASLPTAAAAVRVSVVASTPSAHLLPKNAPAVRYAGSSTTTVEGDRFLPTGAVMGSIVGAGLLSVLVGALLVAKAPPPTSCGFFCSDFSDQATGGIFAMVIGGGVVLFGLLVGAVMGIINTVRDRGMASVPSRQDTTHADFQDVETTQPSAHMEAAMAARGLVPRALPR